MKDYHLKRQPILFTIYFLLLFLLSLKSTAQNSTQYSINKTINGLVYDNETKKPIPNATVYEEKKPQKGTITNNEGNFQLKTSTGRNTIIITHLGYQPKIVSKFLTTSQNNDLIIYLEPAITKLSKITLKHTLYQKEKTNNNFIFGNGRSFSTEETSRYAGTLGDPARMVRAYPGVIPFNDDRNDIVIRGNSPTGLSWRIDDIEIPSPNHYGNIGLTGSTVTILNPKMITNSDFILSAFPTEYGNATAGVFDIKLKKGNTKSHDFRIGTGWNGLELAAEGPISKKRHSYIASYRYSFLDLINKAGINTGILPKYQDLTTKLEFHLSDKLKLSTLTLWGTSSISLNDKDNDLTNGEIINTSSDLF